jgi:hypothetical protein
VLPFILSLIAAARIFFQSRGPACPSAYAGGAGGRAPNQREGVYNRPLFLSELIDLRIRESPTDAPHFSFRLNLPYSDPLLNPIWTVTATP